MGLRPGRTAALKTLDFCAGMRELVWDSLHAIYTDIRSDVARVLERFLPPPPVVLAAVAVAICSGHSRSPKKINPMADLSDAEYRHRYEQGRRRYLAERAVQKAMRQAWIRENGPWLLLAVIGLVLVLVLGMTHPHRLIVIMSLALYSGLAWVVCWAVRASC